MEETQKYQKLARNEMGKKETNKQTTRKNIRKSDRKRRKENRKKVTH